MARVGVVKEFEFSRPRLAAARPEPAIVIAHYVQTKRNTLQRPRCPEVRFSDRVVDLLEEGIDMAVRLGEPGNSAFLASRCLGHQRVVTCASPAYLADCGLLACVSDLAAHDCLTFASAGGVLPWTQPEGSAGTTSLLIDGRHTISDGEALRSAVLDGAGIAQLPTWLVADELRSGALVAVLAAPGYTRDPDTGYVAVDTQSRAENPGDRG
ncbi:LysR substrate-binding domain-containing protein [Stenotrophomonas maltophilia]|uniref:LysR substrate-binding domain-containing protein n=1 Tax=Stenotrophomonas maltophilia TaxID=40324 RepID=UPI003D9C6B62